MFPYFLLLLIPSAFAMFNTNRLSTALWWSTFVIFVFFIGLRFEVGPDWQQYNYIHSTLAYSEFWDVVIQAEPLSYTLFWISEHIGAEVYFSNVVAAIIVMAGVFAFARRTTNPWLALVSATPYFIIVMGMSGVRQSMAAGIVLFLFSRWERNTLITRALYILISAAFHTSALINNIFLVIKMKIPLRYKAVMGFFIAVITLYFSFQVPIYSENIARYQERYIESSMIEQSFGSIYHIAMIAFPALLGFAYRKRILPYIHNRSLLHFGLYASLGIFLMNFASTTAASRLTIYLYFVPMMVYPAIVSMYGRRPQAMMMMTIIVFHYIILATWFVMGNHAYAYIPYKNLLFHDTF